MEIFLMIALSILTLLGAALSNIISDEFRAWQPRMVRALLNCAVALMPASERERWSEEWAGYCEDIPGKVGQMVAAFGLIVAAWKISSPNRGVLTAKRMIDVALSFAAIWIAAPLLLITAMLIRLTSDGPIFLSDRIVGANGKVFRALRFRTYTFVDGQARSTAIGRLLRRTSLAELPLLINVVKGDMSFVGPMPRSERAAAAFEAYDPDASEALNRIRPGMLPIHDEWMRPGVSRAEVAQRRLAREKAYADKPSLKVDFLVFRGAVVYAFTGKLPPRDPGGS